jgi:ABC-type glycerol-3-phosphate transport system permease component
MREKLHSRLLAYVALVLVSVVVLFPVLFTLSTAFKTNADAESFPPKLFSFKPTSENFQYLFDDSEFWNAVQVSIIVAVLTTIMVLVVATPLAYSLARTNYPFKKLIVLLLTLVQVTPAIVLMVPLFVLVSQLGQYDKILPQVLILAALTLPFGTWILVAFIKAIPIELEEAAVVDGASSLQVIRLIIAPLLVPGLTTVAIFTLIGAWNEFLVPMVVSESKAMTVPVFITRFITERSIDYGLLAAACAFLFIPVLLFTVLAKRYIVDGLLAGSTKG